jgi:hypothetical protein
VGGGVRENTVSQMGFLSLTRKLCATPWVGVLLAPECNVADICGVSAFGGGVMGGWHQHCSWRLVTCSRLCLVRDCGDVGRVGGKLPR